MKNIKNNAFNVELVWVNSEVCDAIIVLVTPSPVLLLQSLDHFRIFHVFAPFIFFQQSFELGFRFVVAIFVINLFPHFALVGEIVDDSFASFTTTTKKRVKRAAPANVLSNSTLHLAIMQVQDLNLSFYDALEGSTLRARFKKCLVCQVMEVVTVFLASCLQDSQDVSRIRWQLWVRTVHRFVRKQRNAAR